MPFESQAQRRFMYAKDPKMARRFEKKTPKNKKLPERKGKPIREKQIKSLKQFFYKLPPFSFENYNNL